jgi:hypothetical protein
MHGAYNVKQLQLFNLKESKFLFTLRLLLFKTISAILYALF